MILFKQHSSILSFSTSFTGERHWDRQAEVWCAHVQSWQSMEHHVILVSVSVILCSIAHFHEGFLTEKAI